MIVGDVTWQIMGGYMAVTQENYQAVISKRTCAAMFIEREERGKLYARHGSGCKRLQALSELYLVSGGCPLTP